MAFGQESWVSLDKEDGCAELGADYTRIVRGLNPYRSSHVIESGER
jgi:hypothetical protein